MAGKCGNLNIIILLYKIFLQYLFLPTAISLKEKRQPIWYALFLVQERSIGWLWIRRNQLACFILCIQIGK